MCDKYFECICDLILQCYWVCINIFFFPFTLFSDEESETQKFGNLVKLVHLISIEIRSGLVGELEVFMHYSVSPLTKRDSGPCSQQSTEVYM